MTLLYFINLAGNPNLCLTDSCKRHKFVIPLIASIGGFLIIVVVPLLIWRLNKKRKGILIKLNYLCSMAPCLPICLEYCPNICSNLELEFYICNMPFNFHFSFAIFHGYMPISVVNKKFHSFLISILSNVETSTAFYNLKLNCTLCLLQF